MADGGDKRGQIVEALMRLAATRPYEDISIRDIAGEAQVSLAEFRDAFPSKGAVLAGFSRRIDRAVLETPLGDLAASSPRDRLFDVLMRRFDALAPYREALREIAGAVRRDPGALLALNQLSLNSMRFMLEAAEIESDGPGAAVVLQGLAIAWSRVFATWLDDAAPEYPRTMAALDRELSRGERLVSGLQRLERFAEPFHAFARNVIKRPTRASGATDATAADPSI